ncbi:hypothetical protein JCM10213v2_008681 [Rhodosporidiobolus nylandii]
MSIPRALGSTDRANQLPSLSRPLPSAIDASSSSGQQMGGTATDSDGSRPATPSKDKMREWTFPRTAGTGGGAAAAAGSNGMSGRRTAVAIDTSTHGRSSSIAPTHAHGSSPSKSPSSIRSAVDAARQPLLSSSSAAAAGNGSKDFRHRPNASLAFAGSATPEIGGSASGGFGTLPLSGSPAAGLVGAVSSKEGGEVGVGEVGRMVYSNVRRRGVSDVAFLLVFGGAFFLFVSSLLGVGYSPSSPSPAPSDLSSSSASDLDLSSARAPVEVEDVAIPAQFLRSTSSEEEQGGVDKEVHNPGGDTSHDDGTEHFGATDGEWEGIVQADAAEGDDDDPSLPIHHARPDSDPALFPEHAHEEADLHAEHDSTLRRPRPARLPLASEDEDETEAEDGEALEVEGEEVAEEEEEEVDASAEDPDSFDDPSLPNYDSDSDGEGEVEEDDTIHPLNPAVHADGSLHISETDGDEEEQLSALEELLDAGLAEVEEQEEEGEGAAGGREEIEALARAKRAREAGRAAVVPKGRMVKVRR